MKNGGRESKKILGEGACLNHYSLYHILQKGGPRPPSTLPSRHLHPAKFSVAQNSSAIHLPVSASPFTLTWSPKHTVVNSPTDGSRELNRSQGENLACRCMIAPQWAYAAHKPCELKYLQEEYKKHRTHMNVKGKDLLRYCLLPAN